MRNNMFVLCISCLFMGVITVIAKGAECKQVRVQKIPNDYVVLAETVVDDLQAFKKAAIVWPTEATINVQTVDNHRKAVQDAYKTTLYWLNTVLHADLVPQESELHLVPLKAHIQGYDAIRIRYKVEDYVVQVMSTSSGITVVIINCGREVVGNPIDLDQAKTYMRQSIDSFLNEADRVKSISMKNVRKTKHGFEGLPEVKPETCNYWWGLMSWWTDGNTVLFSTGKADGCAAEEPTLEKDWLSRE